MTAQKRASRSQAWLLLTRKLVFNLALAVILIIILLLVSAEEVDTIQSKNHINTLQGSSDLQQGIIKWRSRRALLQDTTHDRQAPKSFPPPQGNALVHNPRSAPPGKAFFDSYENGKPPARIPDNPHRLVPPPHP